MTKKKWISLLMVLIGNAIYAFTVKFFVIQANLISCGTTGLALIVQQLTGPSHEGDTLFVLALARAFADEQDLGIRCAHAEYHVGAGLCKGAAVTGHAVFL